MVNSKERSGSPTASREFGTCDISQSLYSRPASFPLQTRATVVFVEVSCIKATRSLPVHETMPAALSILRSTFKLNNHNIPALLVWEAFAGSLRRNGDGAGIDVSSLNATNGSCHALLMTLYRVREHGNTLMLIPSKPGPRNLW